MSEQTSTELSASTSEGEGKNTAEAKGETTATQTAGQKTEAERTFTQADLDRIIQKRLADAETARKKAQDEEDAKKRGEWEKVAAAAEERAKQAEERSRDLAARNAVLLAATTANLHDPDAAFLLIREQIEFSDDGKPVNVEKLVEGLVKAKPWMVKSEAGGNGSAANVAGARTGGQKFDPKNPPSWGQVFNKSR